MQKKFGDRGLTIVGVTDESAGKITPFIPEKGIQYTIALGGAPGYKTRGIPHAWLVDPDGMIVWEGNPHRLGADEIEKHLATAWAMPSLKLPDTLKRASRAALLGQYGKALVKLSKVAANGESAEAGAARTAIERLRKAGESQLAIVEKLGGDGHYGAALRRLARIAAAFKGDDFAARAKARRSEWLREKAIKAERDADALYRSALSLYAEKDYKGAFVRLRKASGKKYEGTRTQKLAKEKLEEVKGYL